MSRHIATHGYKGWAGNRVGTRYLYTFEEAHGAQHQPWFRWKNEEVRKGYFAWALPPSPPTRRSPQMGLFDLLKNTVEGVAETAINVVKLPIGVVTAPLDNGQSIVDAANGVVEGVKKIGDTEKRDDDR